VVRFLAILEMFKRGLVDLHQGGNFGEIEVVWLAGEGVSADELATMDAYDG
jgi:chromatin segregation and condensation protein Rec8/ScpA/Scc1 (kleisin family)